MYQAYFRTVVRLVRVVHVFLGHFHFSQKRPLQKLDANKTSGELPTADIDLICVFKVKCIYIEIIMQTMIQGIGKIKKCAFAV